jgi:multidrug resistance efflux pump
MTGKLDPEYEAEVEKSTRKLEAEWAKAQKKLEGAKISAENARLRAERLEAVRESNRETKKEREEAEKSYRLALEVLAEREEELRELEIMMTTTPAGSQNRGAKSFRSVPVKERGRGGK